MLTIAVSSRALFHIEDGDEIFQTQGQKAFDEYMRSKADVPLRRGTAFPLIRKLLTLNRPGAKRLVDVVMLSRNSPVAGVRIANSIVHHGLDIKGAVFTKGSDRFRFAAGMGVQLFLSANSADVQNAIANGIAAATMLPSERDDDASDDDIRIAFDGDSVLFSSEGDECYREHGLEVFHQTEHQKAAIPLGAGPFKLVLEELHRIQHEFPVNECPLKLALVTARAIPSHGRVMTTLDSWGVVLDVATFANGAPKGPILKAFGADMFFDDASKNIDSARSSDVTSGHVPYGTGHGITEPLLTRGDVPSASRRSAAAGVQEACAA
ncbi:MULTISPECIES: 5'-nucleotidase [unclassified Variovorax]|uniref:5'-nucleotidase n=1 Tax=unclassified Variovorax TaxID=663243 RepID=UPI00076DDF64|nr:MULTISPECIES: 5'-nucleotidase [unclassified Variovorax]KWT98357.1 5'-nucleotidase [Variovorax sp. WDL1]PNG49984.1 hypothetical protein CHC06_05565 [Variovorax sp. B2]PNG50856.1 hypothetical protein CHC07_05470 [Variovorax sp. B4]VTU41681.1 5'-nucleotidase [Variovorax sp. PBL-H6]VTU44618.1 5'-nucleotidase [Variovorax sp. SRS16]